MKISFMESIQEYIYNWCKVSRNVHLYIFDAKSPRMYTQTLKKSVSPWRATMAGSLTVITFEEWSVQSFLKWK